MADETPTLRLGPIGIEDDDEKWGHWAHLLLGATFAGYVVGASPECVTALAAALDPRTTEVLFEQRDAAIEERDRLTIEVRRLEALTAQVDITRLGDAERQIRCNACGHVKAEPREER